MGSATKMLLDGSHVDLMNNRKPKRVRDGYDPTTSSYKRARARTTMSAAKIVTRILKVGSPYLFFREKNFGDEESVKCGLPSGDSFTVGSESRCRRSA